MYNIYMSQQFQRSTQSNGWTAVQRKLILSGTFVQVIDLCHLTMKSITHLRPNVNNNMGYIQIKPM